MKFILTNTDEAFTKYHYQDICQRQPDFKLIMPDSNGRLRRIIDISIDDYPSSNKFSIQGDTLYWGFQWIGTISNQQAVIPDLFLCDKAYGCLLEYVSISSLKTVVPQQSMMTETSFFEPHAKKLVFSIVDKGKPVKKEASVVKRKGIKNTTGQPEPLFFDSTRSSPVFVHDKTSLPGVDSYSAASNEYFK